ncbi:MAG: tetratricopeptide repeat protein [Elusimicrobiota bacterium]
MTTAPGSSFDAGVRLVESARFSEALAVFARSERLAAPLEIDFGQMLSAGNSLESFFKGTWAPYHGSNRGAADYERALAVIGKIKRRLPREGSVFLLEGAVHCAFRFHGRALPPLDRAVSLSPTDAKGYLWRFRAKTAPLIEDWWHGSEPEGFGDRITEALKDLARAQSLDSGPYPSLWKAYFCNAFDKSELFTEADFASLARSTAADPALAHAVRSLILSGRGDRDESLREARRCVESLPDCGWSHAFVARLHAKAGRLAETLSCMDRALKLSPDQGELYAWRGEARRRLGDRRAALSDLTRAARLEPFYDNAFLWRGRAQLALGRRREAIRDLSRALRLRTRSPRRAYALRGEAKYNSGDFRGAIADFDRAAPDDPRDTWLEMWRDLDAAVARHPRTAWVHAWRGRMRMEAGSLDGGREDLEAAVRLDPANGRARAWRGLSMEKQRDFDAAMADYSGALALDPRDAAAYALRGELRASRGDIPGGLRDFDRALAFGGDRGRLALRRGRLHWALGRPREALRDFRDAVWSAPGSTAAYQCLAQAEREFGDEKAARRYARFAAASKMRKGR